MLPEHPLEEGAKPLEGCARYHTSQGHVNIQLAVKGKPQ